LTDKAEIAFAMDVPPATALSDIERAGLDVRYLTRSLRVAKARIVVAPDLSSATLLLTTDEEVVHGIALTMPREVKP
jgi:hypothetical protein